MEKKIAYTLKDIAASLGLTLVGDPYMRVHSVSEPSSAKQGQLALAMSPAYEAQLSEGAAEMAMLREGADWKALGLRAALLAPRPKFALSGLSEMLDPGQSVPLGIHPSAVIDPSAKLGRNLCIGPFCYIGPNVEIGDDTLIGPYCHIGASSVLGDRARLREGVKIGARVRIGDRFIAQPGVVIGADGFSFVTQEISGVEAARATLGDQTASVQQQSWARVHSLGSVTIGDNVELGANTCVDCGTIRDTVLGDGVKCDNLVQIGHNVMIDQHSLICAQVAIAGSTRIGKHVVLGGQTGVSDNLFIGDHVITGGATKVLSNIPAGRVMLGYPAMKMDTHLEAYKALRRLPRLMRDFAEFKARFLNQKDESFKDKN